MTLLETPVSEDGWRNVILRQSRMVMCLPLESSQSNEEIIVINLELQLFLFVLSNIFSGNFIPILGVFYHIL